MSDISYTADLKAALTGRRDAVFVWLCNFEVETEWAGDHIGLPAARISGANPIVQRMEELGALLAEPVDHLLLDRPIDRDYRGYLDKTGLGAPAELITDASAGGGGTGRATLDSPALMRRLKELAAAGAYLMPMGTAAPEQQIAEATGLRLAVPDAPTFERVNSKIYSRRLTEAAGLRQVPGYCCETVGRLRKSIDQGLAAGIGPLVVKDAYGVSGKGLVVIDSPAKGERLLRMVERRADNTGNDAIHVVVERFLPKRFDLNYQVTIGRTGRVRLDFVKEAVTSGGVHLGHVMPADLTAAQHAEIADAAEKLGARLYADGYFGVVGVDALIGSDGLVYPVLEINARLNMSTYQGRVTERFLPPGSAALAKHYPLRSAGPISFDEIDEALGAVATLPRTGAGLVITCFGTVNAQADGSAPVDGRLYCLLVADGRAELHALDRRVGAALSRIGASGGRP